MLILKTTVFIISKIQIESYSQLTWTGAALADDCVHYFKDTNWKLFTTHFGFGFSTIWLCSLFQRYKLKAIHNGLMLPLSKNILCSLFQRYKLKAIHNVETKEPEFIDTVFIISKIQIESYSQRSFSSLGNFGHCVHYFKDTNWKLFTTSIRLFLFSFLLCSLFQRYKLKAIHNYQLQLLFFFVTVFIISKIQIESYSQQPMGMQQIQKQLCSLFQRYKLKAIHNEYFSINYKTRTVFIISKIQIESYSQQLRRHCGYMFYCVHYFKDTNWKLFTTHFNVMSVNHLLCSLFQRYKLKAIHNWHSL